MTFKLKRKAFFRIIIRQTVIWELHIHIFFFLENLIRKIIRYLLSGKHFTFYLVDLLSQDNYTGACYPQKFKFLHKKI